MFEIGARLFACGAVGALVVGSVDSFAALLAVAPSRSDPLLSWWNVNGLAIGTAVFGLLSAPLTMLLLPLTWLAFRRSRYRSVALVAMGVLGGVVWSLKLEMFDGDLWLDPGLGVLSGLGAATCFLGLRAPRSAASAEQA